ncbi:MAG: hypothetical protein ABI400_12585 [Lacisediminihabitans sp.]
MIRTIPLGTVFPGVLLVIGLVRQDHLDDALRQDWFVLVLAFVVGALTVALPRKFPLLAAIVAIVVFAGISTSTAFAPIALMCSVLAGFFFGLFVRALLFQGKHWNDPRSNKVHR